MAARYKSRKPAPTFSNHLNDTKCVLLFSPLKHYKHLQEFQMALKTMPHPPKKSLGGTGPCSKPCICNYSMEQCSLRRMKGSASLLGLQLGVGRLVGWRSENVNKQHIPLAPVGRRRDFLAKRERMRDCREKPRENHRRFSSKRTLRSALSHRYQWALLSAAGNAAILSSKIHLTLMLVGKYKPTSPPAQTLCRQSALCCCSCKGVFSSREGSWSSISKTKLQLSSQRVRKKLFYAATQIKPSHRNKAPNVSSVLGRSLICIFKGKSSPTPFPPSINWN